MPFTKDLETYRGNCHCGAYVYEVKTHEIKTAIGCNCSSCLKKAYLWLFLPEGSVTVVKDEGLLTEFMCGPHNSTHGFCSRCGISALATNPSYRPGIAVNVCLGAQREQQQCLIMNATGPHPPRSRCLEPKHTSVCTLSFPRVTFLLGIVYPDV